MEQASKNWGPYRDWAARIMAVVVMISTFGCLNGMILMGARLYYAMAKDSLFFRGAGHLNARGVPAVALILQGIWSAVLIFTGTYNELLDYVIFAALLFYAITVVGLFVLRRTEPNADRTYKVTGYPFLPALYVLLCGLVMIDLLIVKPNYTWPGLLIVLAGLPVYVLWRMFGGRRASRAGAAVHAARLQHQRLRLPSARRRRPHLARTWLRRRRADTRRPSPRPVPSRRDRQGKGSTASSR